MNNIVVGGTFNKLHKGHKSLLALAFVMAGDGGFVTIGVTTDEYISKYKQFYVPYETRVLRIKKYLEYENNTNFRVLPLDDAYGDSTTNQNYSGIVVSPETVEGANKINEIRKANGLKELRIFKAEHVLDEDGRIISSSRIMNGEIDESGKYRKNMKITILGTSGGMSSATRASAGYVVEYKGTTVLFDCGDLTSRQLQLARIDVGKIDAIFISHPHLDHYIGLPLLIFHHMMMFGRTKELHVYCPTEVTDNLASIFKNNTLPMPFPLQFSMVPASVQVGDLKFEACVVDHGIPDCFGFKVTNNRGKSVAYSGDTKPSVLFQELAQNADVMIHEATFASEWEKDTHGHSRIREAIEVAQLAKVHQLILTHISIKYHGDIAGSYAKDIVPTEFRVTVGEDLDTFEI